MIRSLQIRNYAIIDALEIHFSDGLTIITGETGAGKSILLGALGLIMGERADTKSLYNTEEKCVIEGRFAIRNYDLQTFFRENDLDYEEELIIRREIAPSGKSRAFVNDTPVNLKVLQSLSAALVDLHQQFDTLDIHSVNFQLRLIDALAENRALLQNYQQGYREYSKTLQRLEDLRQRTATASRDLEFISFQLDELHKASLVADEQEQLEEELSRLTNAEEIKRTTAAAYQQLSESELPVIGQLQQVAINLHQLAKVDSNMQQFYERVNSAVVELEDLVNELESYAESTDYDPERIQEVQARVDLIYRLQKKHGVTTVEELLAIQADLEEQASAFEDLSGTIERLEKELDERGQSLRTLAAELSERRKAVAPSFGEQVQATLAELAMPAARMEVDFRPLEELTATGLDEIEFLFTANRGSRLMPIRDVASGGELSRLTLVTKSLVARFMALPTLIFDEIDAGVSGDVALRMGGILRRLSDHHQVVVITHSPQVASRADAHYFIYKVDDEERTTTKVRLLSQDERVRAIATMLSQSPPSDSALENARELMSLRTS